VVSTILHYFLKRSTQHYLLPYCSLLHTNSCFSETSPPRSAILFLLRSYYWSIPFLYRPLRSIPRKWFPWVRTEMKYVPYHSLYPLMLLLFYRGRLSGKTGFLYHSQVGNQVGNPFSSSQVGCRISIFGILICFNGRGHFYLLASLIQGAIPLVKLNWHPEQRGKEEANIASSRKKALQLRAIYLICNCDNKGTSAFSVCGLKKYIPYFFPCFAIWMLTSVQEQGRGLIANKMSGRAAREEAVAVVELVLHTLLDKEGKARRISTGEKVI